MKIKVIGGICLLLVALVYSCQSDGSIEFRQYYTAGSLVYQSHCQNCHGAKGEGLAGLIPPLTDTLSIKARKNTLSCIVQNGLGGPLKAAGKTFDGQMPAANLSPIEVAQVLTYVTNSFGNKLGVTTDDDVNADLKKCGVN
jgi:mono/diheme cytochrome c family protein